jgi:hypothetical protein
MRVYVLGKKMQKFLEKYNYNYNADKQKRKYNIVRFYPKVETYEFLNVGIIVEDNNQLYFRLISQSEIAQLHCPALVESKLLKQSVKALDEFLNEKVQKEDAISYINNNYTNLLDTSFQLQHLGNEKIDELVNNLFELYVGYKFNIKDSHAGEQKIITKTKEIIKSEFPQKIKVQKSKIQGFTLDFYSQKTKKVIHSIMGSVNNTKDLSKAFSGAPIEIKPNEKFDFLHTVQHVPSYPNIEKLKRLHVDVKQYTKEEDIISFCKEIVD